MELEVKINIIIFIVISLTLIALLFMITPVSISLEGEEAYMKCEDKELDDAVNCLKDYMEGFYNYSIQAEDIDRTLNDIKENGGDCSDYSILYKRMAEDIGLQAQIIELYGDDAPVGHAYAVIWDKELTGYCNVDMMNVECGRLA